MSIGHHINNDSHENHLALMGWDPHFQTQLNEFPGRGLTPARVVGVRKNSFRVSDGQSEWLATLAGRLTYDPDGRYPVTGDWVLVGDSVIFKVLARKNVLSRMASGTRFKADAQAQKEQAIAANLDTVLIVCGLDRDFNLRRIERYLTLIYNCGLNPAVILTKADLHSDPERFAEEVEAVAFGVPVHLVTASDDECLNALGAYLSSGMTATMVGSSGAGKSTLVNRLCGEEVQLTSSVSAHLGKGRHTTTSRDLIVTPQGGMIIDNPGIREIAFWESEDGMGTAFPEIERLGAGCRFADCSHTHEPGCKVRKAVQNGEIPEGRLNNYLKMKRELDYISQRRSKSADRVEKERWKDVALKIKSLKKGR